MSEALRLAGALAASCGLALLTVPAAAALALRMGFFDLPRGYRAHRAPTPYLGGLAVLVAFLPAAVAFGDPGPHAPILACAVALAVLGTWDDRRHVAPGLRVLAELGAATVLWTADLGWAVTSVGVLDLALTWLWVVGIVNAFNLMDNMDGAAGSVALVSAAGLAVLAATRDELGLAALAVCVAGVCAGFLRYNLAAPARIFLGDGGSMWLGFAIVALAMAVAGAEGGGGAPLLVGALLVAVPILDTTLVVVSRTRRGISVLTGGRDHLSHRLRIRLPSARAVAAALGVGQAALAAVAIGLAEAPGTLVTTAAVGCVAAGILLVAHLDSPAWNAELAARVTGSAAASGDTAPAGASSP